MKWIISFVAVLGMLVVAALPSQAEVATYTVVSPSFTMMGGGSQYVPAPGDTAWTQDLIAEGEVQAQKWFYPHDAEDYPWWCHMFGSAYGRIQQDEFRGRARASNRAGLRFGISSEPLYWYQMSVLHARVYVDVSTRGIGPGAEVSLSHIFTIRGSLVDGPAISGGLIIPLLY